MVMGVSRDERYSKPFKVSLWHGGRTNHLGSRFATAELRWPPRASAPPAAEERPPRHLGAPSAAPAPAAAPPATHGRQRGAARHVRRRGDGRGSREEREGRKRKGAIDVDALESEVKVEVKEEQKKNQAYKTAPTHILGSTDDGELRVVDRDRVRLSRRLQERQRREEHSPLGEA